MKYICCLSGLGKYQNDTDEQISHDVSLTQLCAFDVGVHCIVKERVRESINMGEYHRWWNLFMVLCLKLFEPTTKKFDPLQIEHPKSIQFNLCCKWVELKNLCSDILI
eukprot:UN01772